MPPAGSRIVRVREEGESMQSVYQATACSQLCKHHVMLITTDRHTPFEDIELGTSSKDPESIHRD